VSYQVLVENRQNARCWRRCCRSDSGGLRGAVRAASYEPGAVLPTSLASLGLSIRTEPVLAANLGALALTTSITYGQDLLLYRSLDLPEEPSQRLDEVQRGIAVAAAYFEDKVGARPGAAFCRIGAGMGLGEAAPQRTLPAGYSRPATLD